MLGSGKVAGLILIGAAIILEVIAVLWLLSQVGEGKQQGGAFILGLGLAQVLALPMFAELRDEEQQYVVEMIAEFYS